MGKKKSEDAGPSTKAKPGSKDVSKKEKISVSAMLAGMDEKADKPKKASSNKAKPKPAPKASAYTDDIDLPPSDDDESEEEQEEKHRPDLKPLEVSIAEKELKKREKKDILAAHVAEQAKKEALRDDRDAFTVVIGSRASVLDGDDGADANVKDITIENFSVAARGKELLKNTSVKISHGKRYGLIGPNGMGKSTLLKLLAWRKIPVPKNIDVLLVEQEVVGDDKTALEAVVSANVELIKVRQKVADLQNIASGEEGMDKDHTNEEEDAGEKLAELYEQLQLMGSDAAESQASKILAGLGFTKDMQGRPTKSFSGGWRMRISLARALFVQPTLLLLDEPTNHLDLRAVLWLEEYLCRWKKTLVVVSHDRDFLNTVCSEIIHLHDLKLHFYRGNFDAFESGYEQRRREANKKYEIFDKQLKAARRTGNKAQQDKVKDRAKFAAAKESKSKSKGKVDEDETQVEVPHKWRDYSVEFHFPEPTELTPPLLQLIEVSFSYPNREDFRLSDVDVGIDSDVLLLDEITVDLDVLARADLLKFLRKECDERGATIIYATHIFDGLEDWPTNIVYVAHGRLELAMPIEKVKETSKLSLMRTVEVWLRKERDEDRRQRKERKAAGLPEFDKQVDGSRVVGGDPTRAPVRVTNNGWAAGRLHSTIAGEENFLLSSNRVLRG